MKASERVFILEDGESLAGLTVPFTDGIKVVG